MTVLLCRRYFWPSVIVLSIVGVLFISDGSPAQTWQVRWYAVHEELNARGQSVNFGNSAQTLVLKGGWSCTVAADLNQGILPTSQARVTVCQRGTEGFEFSVLCDRSQPRYHTQIRFRTEDKLNGEFIEVGCELIP